MVHLSYMYIVVIILECVQHAERKMSELEKSNLSLSAHLRKESKDSHFKWPIKRSRNERRQIDRLSAHLYIGAVANLLALERGCDVDFCFSGVSFTPLGCAYMHIATGQRIIKK